MFFLWPAKSNTNICIFFVFLCAGRRHNNVMCGLIALIFRQHKQNPTFRLTLRDCTNVKTHCIVDSLKTPFCVLFIDSCALFLPLWSTKQYREQRLGFVLLVSGLQYFRRPELGQSSRPTWRLGSSTVNHKKKTNKVGNVVYVYNKSSKQSHNSCVKALLCVFTDSCTHVFCLLFVKTAYHCLLSYLHVHLMTKKMFSKQTSNCTSRFCRLFLMTCLVLNLMQNYCHYLEYKENCF